MLIEYAYNGNQAGFYLRDDQVSGGPSWLESDKYEVDAKVEDSLASRKWRRDFLMSSGHDQIRLMRPDAAGGSVQVEGELHQTKELPVFALVVAKNGPKLHRVYSSAGDTYPGGYILPEQKYHRHGLWESKAKSLGSESLSPWSQFARYLLSRQPELEGREVKDETALKGTYDFTLHWTSDQSQPTTFKLPSPATESAPPSGSSGPSLFSALQEQLGLKLESAKAPVEVLMIDHIERPSEN